MWRLAQGASHDMDMISVAADCLLLTFLYIRYYISTQAIIRLLFSPRLWMWD